MNEFEAYLKGQGWYAHDKRSFDDRPYWKGWTFQRKLINLGWEFNQQGELTNTDW
jgi:hypothetical protein